VRLTNEQQELVTEFLAKYPDPLAAIRVKSPGQVNAYLLNKVGDKDDLCQIALLAVVRAAYSYRHDRGVAFATYAINGIKLAVRGSLQKFNADSRKVPTKLISGDGVKFPSGDSFWNSVPSPEATPPTYSEEEVQKVRALVAELPTTSRTILTRFYGIGCEPQSTNEIAAALHKNKRTIQFRRQKLESVIGEKFLQVLSHTTEDIPCNA
jgi:DNA-directed RNA polymerase specialized sigma24 family protein